MFTKNERKEKVEKIKYKSNDTNYLKEITKFEDDLPDLNVISNEDYLVCTDKKGTGFSKYKNILINRYKKD